jgi:NADPH:quinone reductase-like Zn-dependent oxidoreductase
MLSAQKIVIHKAGGYETLKIENFEPAPPKAQEVLVASKAAGINYADICVRWGVYESAKKYVGWPITPGFEFAGIVVATGTEVRKFEIGDAVFGVSRFGAYASHIIVPQHQLYKKPAALSFEQAAGLPAVYLTAYHALFQNIIIRPHSKILIHSAAGGVGSALVQMSKLKGHRVLGIVGNPAKKEYVLQLGADKVVSKREENWVAAAKKFSPEGYDVVLDANGYETLKDGYDILAPMGKLISYGFHTMLPKKGGRLNWAKIVYSYLKTPRFNPVNMTSANKSLLTFNLSFLFDHHQLLTEAMAEILKWIQDDQLKAPKVAVYDYKAVAKAHRDIESGNTMGKLVLKF